jgi:hypothetical protein
MVKGLWSNFTKLSGKYEDAIRQTSHLDDKFQLTEEEAKQIGLKNARANG